MFQAKLCGLMKSSGTSDGGAFMNLNEYFMHFPGSREMLIPGTDLPPDWMLAAAVHVWARGRGREGAEVKGQGSG